MPERVRYLCTEDEDDPEHPNVFELPGPAGLDVRLADIKQFFPLSGSFHFRFKRRVGGVCVWVDVGEENETVPRFQDDGAIFARVTRLNAQAEEEGRLGAIRSFLANLGDDDSRGVASGLKSYISRACNSAAGGLGFTREDDDEPARRISPRLPGLRRGPSQPLTSEPYSDRPTARVNGSASTAPAAAGQRHKQQVSAPPKPRFASKNSLNKSASDLGAVAHQETRSRSVKSASPPRSSDPTPAPTQLTSPPSRPPPPQPPQPPQPPPSDLLDLDTHPSPVNPAPKQQQPTDWQAFVGLDSSPQQPQQQHQPMRPPSGTAQLDPFAMGSASHQNRPHINNFDAFAGF